MSRRTRISVAVVSIVALLGAVASLLLGVGENPELGAYRLCVNVEAYADETIVLLEGSRFKYWASSDVFIEGVPSYPIEGRYAVQGSTLRLFGPRIAEGDSAEPNSNEVVRTWSTLNGVRVLWRNDGLQEYKKSGWIRPYSVLIYAGPYTDDRQLPSRQRYELLGATFTDKW